MTKFLILFALLYSALYSQSDESVKAPGYLQPSPRFSHLTNDNGLSQGFISNITQDNKGFMWFATADGLNRYDGYYFKVFRFDAFDTSTIQDNFITDLLKDKSGKLWVGTFSKGLSCYNDTTESFFRFSSEQDEKNSIAGTRIYSIIEDKFSELPTYWIVTNSSVLNQLVLLPDKKYLADPLASLFPESGKWIAEGYRVFQYSLITSDSLKLLSGGKYSTNAFEAIMGKNSVVIDDNHNLWIGFLNRRLVKISLENNRQTFTYKLKSFSYPVWQPDRLTLKQLSINGFPVTAANEFDRTCLFKAQNGSIWAGINNGFFQITNERSELINKGYKLKQKENVQSILIDEIAEDHQGRLWIASTIGLFSFNPGKRELTPYYHDASNPETPAANYFSSVYIDAGNIVWCGSYGYGISYFDPRSEVFHHYNDMQNKNFNVYDIEESRNGNLWIRRGFIDWLYFNRQTGSFVKPPVDLNKYFFVKSLIEDKNGNVWFISEDNLYFADEKNITFVYQNNPKCTIQYIYDDGSGSIWAASPAEVFNVDIKTRGIKKRYNIKNSLSSNELLKCEISGIYKGENNLLWLISNTGLFALNLESGEIKRFKTNPRNRHGLNSDELMSIHPDPINRGILWIGTKGGGLNRFDTITEQVQCYTIKDGLPNNVIYGLLSDDKNNIWMSTNFGISCMELAADTLHGKRIVSKVKQFINYDRSEGLQGNEFNSRSFLKTSKGELIFGGLNGFNIFKPEDITGNNHIPGIILTGLIVNYKTTDFKSPGSFLNKPVSGVLSITLPYDQNTLMFEFASLDYSSVPKNQFSYILEGYSDEWSKPQINRTATFTQIPPGRYILRVTGSNSSGVWNREGVSVEIIIIPPFWLTWWFTTISAILFFLLVFISIRWISIRKLKRNIEILRKENEIRTKISRDLHDEIGSRVTQISLYSSLLSDGEKNNKNFDWGIKNIGEAASDIVTALDEVVWTINPVNDNINNFAGYVVQFATDYLDKANIRLVIDVPDTFPLVSLVSDKRHRILMTVKEALSNIVKHSGADMVNLKVDYKELELKIYIKDNGTGFSDGDVRLFGNGLKAMKNRIEEISGRFHLSSVQGEGTEIKIQLRLEEK